MARQNFTGLPDTDHTIIRNDLTSTTRDFQILERNRGAENGTEESGTVPQLGRQTSLETHIADSFALGTNAAAMPQENSEIFSGGDVFVRNTDEVNENPDAPIVENDTLETNAIERCEIKRQPSSWYKILCTPSECLIFKYICSSENKP